MSNGNYVDVSPHQWSKIRTRLALVHITKRGNAGGQNLGKVDFNYNIDIVPRQSLYQTTLRDRNISGKHGGNEVFFFFKIFSIARC